MPSVKQIEELAAPTRSLTLADSGAFSVK